MSEIFVTKDGRQRGPFSPSEVRRLVAAGDLSLEDIAWREGMELWEPLGKILPPDLPPGPPEPPKRKGREIWFALLGVGVAVGLLIACGVVYVSCRDFIRAFKKGAESVSGGPSPRQAPVGTDSDAWRKITLRDLTLEAPFDFKKQSPESAGGTFGNLDPGDLKEVWMAENSDVSVIISFFEIGKGTDVNLDETGEAIIETSAKQIGTSVPRFSVEEFPMGGLPARLISAKFPMGKNSRSTGEPAQFPIKSVLIQSGSQLIQVFIFHLSQEPAAAEFADGIIDSLHVGPSASSASSRPASPASFSHGGVTLDAPFSFTKSSAASAGVSQSDVDAVAHNMEVWTGGNRDVIVVVAIVKYREGATVSLDGVVNAQLEISSRKFGIAVPEHSIEEHSVKGLPARLISATFPLPNKVSGEILPVPMRSVAIQSGTRMVQVVVFHASQTPEAAELTDAIIASVSLDPS